jgi:hypothetical protein
MSIQPASSQPHTVPVAPSGPDRAVPASTVNASLLTVGLVAAVVGIVVEVAMGLLHPSHAQPNDSAAAFEEYSHSQDWTYVHIGQFAGTLLVVIALVAIARTLSGQPGMAGAMAVVGAVTAVLVGAVFAVQMAVDGVALKGTVDTWAHASTAADRSEAFVVADGVRWIEKALSSFFHLLNGTTLLALGLSVLFGQMARRWLGWVGVVAGNRLPRRRSHHLAHRVLAGREPGPHAGAPAQRGVPDRDRGLAARSDTAMTTRSRSFGRGEPGDAGPEWRQSIKTRESHERHEHRRDCRVDTAHRWTARASRAASPGR